MLRFSVMIVCFLMLWLFSPVGGYSGEVKFPVPSYEGQELQKVRQWEEKWANKKISAENVDQVKEFVPEGMYTIMKDPESFGAESIWFTVLPYRPYTLSKGIIEATQKYAPTSRIVNDDMLEGYGQVAGIPFPEPKTGIEMAWNFDGNTKGDSHREKSYGTVANCRTGNERTAGMVRWELNWIGRTDMEPKPNVSEKDNPRGIARSFFQRHTAPVDFVDTAFLELKWKDPDRDQAVWVYTVMFRRIRRYSTSQRTDSIDGTDMVYDDIDGWYTHVIRNNYDYKGRADLLVGRHQDPDKLERAKGQAVWNGVQRERANHWVVEVTNKQKNYLYSKQIWYLDPETWQMNFKVMYNRLGQFWKMQELFYDELPNVGGEKTASFTADHIFDLIRRHGTTEIRGTSDVGKKIRYDFFQTKSLKQKSY
jgi:hypothetical protein